MQTERKTSPAGKTKDVWDDVDESFFKVRGTRESAKGRQLELVQVS